MSTTIATKNVQEVGEQADRDDTAQQKTSEKGPSFAQAWLEYLRILAAMGVVIAGLSAGPVAVLLALAGLLGVLAHFFGYV